MAKPMVLVKQCVLNTMAGRQTRHSEIIKPQPDSRHCRIDFENGILKESSKVNGCWHVNRKWKPRYQVGDEVYIAEGYRIPNMDMDRAQALMVHYLSDRTYKSVKITEAEMKLFKARKFPFRAYRGRFMYKSLARTFRTITGVGVERLHQISDADVVAEGVEQHHIDKWKRFLHPHDVHGHAFGELWNSIHGKDAWDLNPWIFWYKYKE